MKVLKKVAEILVPVSSVIWIGSIVVTAVAFLIATNGLQSTIQTTSFGNSNTFIVIIGSAVIIGALAFIVLALLSIGMRVIENRMVKAPTSIIGIPYFFIKTLLLLLIFPLYLITYVFKRDRLVVSTVKALGIILILLPIWVGSYGVIGYVSANQLGYIAEPISISGTGSMHPTFPKGQGKTIDVQTHEIVSTPGMFRYPNGLFLFGNNYFGHTLSRGDIVVVENEKIRETTRAITGFGTGWVKRLIGLPGDTIELRSGIVYLNGEPLREQYTARPQSTFGGTFLKECIVTKIPEGFIFVMGDNRKGSSDSREVGFVEVSAINYVLPLSNQVGYLDTNWRNTVEDFDVSQQITLDKQRFLSLINQKRTEKQLRRYTYQLKLEQSAAKRGEFIVKNIDVSGKPSDYDMGDAIRDVGYWNPVLNEGNVTGHFEAEELMEFLLESPAWVEFFEDTQLQELGVAEVQQATGCSSNVIVIHSGGYIPATYEQNVVDSWRNSASRLTEVIESWEKVRGFEGVNQQDLQQLIGLLQKEKDIATGFVAKMEARQWWNSSDDARLSLFNQMSTESSALAKKLNGEE